MRMYNPAMAFTNLIFFLSYMFSISLTTGTICYNNGNFTTNSTYERNRHLILSSLASNVSVNDGFYHTATIGQEPNTVYALALCRGDSSSEYCASCISSAAQDLMKQCPNQKEAISWGGEPQCIVRYANRSIFGKMELDPMAAGSNNNIITINMTQFDQTWESLMVRMVKKASTGSSKNKFATGEANVTYFVKIYALMQCTPDISQSDCEYCLRQSVAYSQSRDHGKQGTLIVRPSCIYRWNIDPFYETITDIPSPSPPTVSSNIPPPLHLSTTPIKKEKGSITSGTVIIIVVSAIIFTALVALTYIFLQVRKQKQEIRSNKQEAKEYRAQ